MHVCTCACVCKYIFFEIKKDDYKIILLNLIVPKESINISGIYHLHIKKGNVWVIPYKVFHV